LPRDSFLFNGYILSV